MKTHIARGVWTDGKFYWLVTIGRNEKEVWRAWRCVDFETACEVAQAVSAYLSAPR